MKAIWISVLGLVGPWHAWAAESAPAKPAEPMVEKLGENQYRIGVIELDAVKREIRFPAVVNQEEGPLEYLLVHDKGKVHESLLRTGVPPAHLQVALKLLRFRAGPGRLFDHLLPPGKAPQQEPAGEELELLVAWAEMPELPLRKAILDRSTREVMDNTPWVFTGSEILQGEFQAEVEGSIVAIYRDSLAMINTLHPDAVNDEAWAPILKVLPAKGTQLQVIIRPWKKEP